jgi:hypothetical protein
MNWKPQLDIKFPKILDSAGNLVQPGTYQAQFNIDEQSCGVVVTAAIVATHFCEEGGVCLTANDFYALVEELIPSVGGGLTQRQLAKVIDELTPYSATIYWMKLETGENIVNMLNLNDDAAGVGINLLAELLKSGDIPIVGVEVHGSDGYLSSSKKAYHWEILIGLSPQMDEVLTYNPFHNTLEVYSTETFLTHWIYPYGEDGYYPRELIAVDVD